MEMGAIFQQRVPQKAETDQPDLTGIPAQMKLNFEQRSGMSFDDVRVHYNSEKPAQFHALAYTQGTQIYIGPGQERSLPHELGHVIQQKAGRVRPTRWVRGQPVNDQPELEREADRPPVQCMPAPALWGVIQMTKFGVMPSQSSSNCGYHALARAINALYDGRFDPVRLEKGLTEYAKEHKYSAIGEAFDPNDLALVGNEFCGSDLGKEMRLSITCSVVVYDKDTVQKEIAKGGIVLVPYLPFFPKWGDYNMEKEPYLDLLGKLGGFIEQGEQDKENTLEQLAKGYKVDRDVIDQLMNIGAPDINGGEHWGVIGAIDGAYKLFEGNLRGSTFGGGRSMPPLEADLDALYESNHHIASEFNWSAFPCSMSDRRLLYSKMAADKAKPSSPFKWSKGNLLQELRLNGYLVVVQRNQ